MKNISTKLNDDYYLYDINNHKKKHMLTSAPFINSL